MHNESVIGLSDLRYISITCQECRTVVTLDMQEPSDFSAKHDFCPQSCPGCQRQYDSAIAKNVNGFQKSYRLLTVMNGRIHFRGTPVTEVKP